VALKSELVLALEHSAIPQAALKETVAE